MKKKRKLKKKSKVKASLLKSIGKAKTLASALKAKLIQHHVSLLLVYLVVRVEMFNSKLDTLTQGLLDLGVTIYVNLVTYQMKLESAFYALFSLLGGEAS